MLDNEYDTSIYVLVCSLFVFSVVSIMFCTDTSSRNSIQFDQIGNVRAPKVEAATEPVNELPKTSFDGSFAPRDRLVASNKLNDSQISLEGGVQIHSPTSDTRLTLAKPTSRTVGGRRKDIKQKEMRVRSRFGSLNPFRNNTSISEEDSRGSFSFTAMFTLRRQSRKISRSAKMKSEPERSFPEHQIDELA